MEVELPDTLRVKWTEAGSLLRRAHTIQTMVTPPTGRGFASPSASLAASTSGAVSGSNLSVLLERINGVKQWYETHQQSSGSKELFFMKFNVAQQHERLAIADEELAARAAMLTTHNGATRAIRASIALSEQESSARKGVIKEFTDFFAFASSKEPQWRHVAKHKAEIRNFVDFSMSSLRADYEQELGKVADTLCAIGFQERDERDNAKLKEMTRIDQDASVALARQFERQQLQAQRDAELKRIADLQARQQQQQRPSNGYGQPPQQQQQFAMPPANLYGGSGTNNYNYNYGPSAGAAYGGYPGNVRR